MVDIVEGIQENGWWVLGVGNDSRRFCFGVSNICSFNIRAILLGVTVYCR